MLRIAVQSKGRLYDETMMLLEEAGIKLNRGKRILLLSAKVEHYKTYLIGAVFQFPY